MASDQFKQHQRLFATAKAERDQWLPLWRQLNDAFFPYLYRSLRGLPSLTEPVMRNTKLLDASPANALYTLAAGFMNGVTSPARKWLNVRRPLSQPFEEEDGGASLTHSKIRQSLLEILSNSNYYDNRAVQVWDGCGLGSSLLLCYEDRDSVCKFMVVPPGSFAFVTNNYNEVVAVTREFKMRSRDLLTEFGEAVLPKAMVSAVAEGRGETEHVVYHVIEANAKDGLLKARTPFREVYWLAAKQETPVDYLAVRPLWEWPASIFRWHCPDNSTYGVPPTMAALGQAIKLQNMEYKTDQGLDKMVSPPLLADYTLRNRPKAFQANGVTFTNNLSPNSGARPLYQMQMPFQELEYKRKQIVGTIEEALFNPLFNMISQLDTVRSATEIDARREEKLVMLGPVLQRSYTEDLAPLVMRVFGIASRKGLMPELEDDEAASVEFSNILSDVQRASDVSTIERFFGFTGQVIPVFPDIQSKVNAFDLIKQYAEGLGIRPSSLRTDEEAQGAVEQSKEMAQMQQLSEVAKNFGAAAGSVGQMDVGGGMSAVAQGL